MLGVGGRNGLHNLFAGHPINAHDRGCLSHILGFAMNTPTSRRPLGTGATSPSHVYWKWNLCVIAFESRDGEPVSLKNSMPPHPETKHGTTKGYGVNQWCSHHVFDHKGNARRQKPFPDRANKVGILLLVDTVQSRVGLTRGACPDEVKPLKWKGHGVGLTEHIGVVLLKVNIDADNILKAGVTQPR